MSRLIALAILCLCCSGIVRAEDAVTSTDSTQKPLFEPAKTMVAVLPTASKVTDAIVRDAKAAENAKRMVEEEFSKRGFRLVNADDLANGLKKAKFDPTDVESITKTKLTEVGRELGADIVAHVTLQQFESEARNVVVIRMKVWDVKAEAYLVNGIFKAEKKTISRKKGRMAALEQAVEKSLEDVLKPYRIIENPKESPAGEAK